MLLLAPSVENLWYTASTTCPLGLQGRCARDGLPQVVIRKEEEEQEEQQLQQPSIHPSINPYL
jgi:hypothetical protein